jgi:hypothetical protein
MGTCFLRPRQLLVQREGATHRPGLKVQAYLGTSNSRRPESPDRTAVAVAVEMSMAIWTCVLHADKFASSRLWIMMAETSFLLTLPVFRDRILDFF